MLGISETEIIASLGRDNPWWTTNLALFASPNEKERAYFKSFLNLVTEWKIRRSVILLGPRRVGKTVMLHQLIREVMKAELPAKNVFFASVDTPLYSGIPLATLVEYFEKETKHRGNWRGHSLFRARRKALGNDFA